MKCIIAIFSTVNERLMTWSSTRPGIYTIEKLWEGGGK